MKAISQLILLFVMAQVLGLITGVTIFKDMAQNPVAQSLTVTSAPGDPANAFLFFFYVLFGAVAIVVAIRYFKLNVLIFKLLEFVLISTASSVVFYTFLRLAGLGYVEATSGGIVLGLLLAGLKFVTARVKNISAVMATAGVGVIFGVSLEIFPLIIFLIILTVYDFLSVFVTRHMVEIARYVIKQELAFTVTAKAKVPGEKEERRLDLGTGDMIAPVMFEVSALTVSPYATLMVFLGAVISLAAFISLVWKKKMVLPALPPIVGGMLLFFFIGMLLGLY